VRRDSRPVTILAFNVHRGTDAALPAEAAPASDLGVPNQTVHFSVHCSKGTYIRSLVYDLGRELGSVAHMTSLRRDAIGDLRVEDAWQLPELVDAITAARTADMALAAAEEGGSS
jgi:tRNA pseudouridine(55) synthase